jgi:hypothetical protein
VLGLLYLSLNWISSKAFLITVKWVYRLLNVSVGLIVFELPSVRIRNCRCTLM